MCVCWHDFVRLCTVRHMGSLSLCIRELTVENDTERELSGLSLMRNQCVRLCTRVRVYLCVSVCMLYMTERRWQITSVFAVQCVHESETR